MQRIVGLTLGAVVTTAPAALVGTTGDAPGLPIAVIAGAIVA